MEKEQNPVSQEEQVTASNLAYKIMVFARDQIMIHLRFLDRALFRMPMVDSDSVISYGVDGEKIYFNTEYYNFYICSVSYLFIIFYFIII